MSYRHAKVNVGINGKLLYFGRKDFLKAQIYHKACGLIQGPILYDYEAVEAQWHMKNQMLNLTSNQQGVNFNSLQASTSTSPSYSFCMLVQLPLNRASNFAMENDLKSPKRKRAVPLKKMSSQNVASQKEPQEEKQSICDMEDMFSDIETQKIRKALLGWYEDNCRDLPWRRRTNKEEEEEKEKRAYGVWVSEVMLQQTRVKTVIQYYNRWMLKWPTLHHLAQASLEEVNEMWAGLGYYRRARFLLEGAKMIIAGGDGFPKTISSLRKVPGIGEYTAGAIASIAFEEVAPVVDGNVVRVLARLKAIRANPKHKTIVKNFWKLAAQLVDPCLPGDFNQSLMELGAIICTPMNPSCSLCPVSSHCRAYSISKEDKSVVVTDYPAKVLKVKQRKEFSAVCVVEILGSHDIVEGQNAGSRFLLVKRPNEGLLAGLWEFPSITLDKEADLTLRKNEIDHLLKKSFRLEPGMTYQKISREEVGEFFHIFSHIRLKVYVELLVICLKGERSDLFSEQDNEVMSWKCVDSKALATLGLTSGVRKVYNMVQKLKQKKLST